MVFANYFFKTRIYTVFSLFLWWVKNSLYIWALKLNNNIMYRFKLSEIKNAVKELDFMFTDSDTLRDRIEIACNLLEECTDAERSQFYMSCDRCDIVVHISDVNLYYTKESGDGYHDPRAEIYYCRCGCELSYDITFNQYINYTFN